MAIYSVVRKVLLIILLCIYSNAAITFSGVTHTPYSSVSNSPITISFGLASPSDGDKVLCGVVSATWVTSNTGVGYTKPWTSPGGTFVELANYAGFGIWGSVWHSGDPTSITVSPQNGAGGFETGACVFYTGGAVGILNDGPANNFVEFYHSNNGQYLDGILLPAMAPLTQADMLVCFAMDSSNFGDTMSVPAGMTNRIHNAVGPTIDIDDLLLVNANNTGSKLVTSLTTSVHVNKGGVCVLLQDGIAAAQRTVIPTISGFFSQVTHSGSEDFNLAFFPQDKDLIIALDTGGTSIDTFTGYIKAFNNADVGAYCHLWRTGDSTVPGTSLPVGARISWLSIHNYNPDGGTLIGPGVDNFGQNQLSGITITTPNLGLTTTKETFFGFWSSGTQANPNLNTWTMDAALQPIYGSNGDVWNTIVMGVLTNPSNPTGTFSSTITGATRRLGAGALSFKIGGGTCGTPIVNNILRHGPTQIF